MKEYPTDNGRILIELDERETDLTEELRKKYRTSTVGLFEMIFSYYFGDGENHLQCEFCSLGNHTKRVGLNDD